MIYEFTTLYHIHSAICSGAGVRTGYWLGSGSHWIITFISFLGLDFWRLCRKRHVLDIFIV
jgi:hypothetical protein